jgi:glycosyltransferase involved in cell wall biosynthesis
MLYEAAFRSVMSRILKGTDLAHFLGHGVEMLGYSVEAGARRKEIPFVVQPAIHVGQAGHGHADWPLYKKADMVVAHTQFEADTLRQGGIEDSHVHLMRLGFDDPGPGDGARFRQAHGIEGPIILFVGRRCADKGYFLLLEAFATLRKQMPNVTLVIAGPGEIARSTAEGVLELGRVPDEVKRDALAACTVFCMPSKGESFGIVYFEAWNFGKPVIGLDLPILRETIGSSGGGLLAVPDRPDDLVEKLKHLLEQPQLALEMGTRGREYSRSFSWDNALKACIEAYSQAQQNQRQ